MRPPALTNGPLTPPLIAIVDDDPLARASTDTLLHAMGYATATFAGGEAFLVDRRAFACVISDVHMAGMSGPELQRRLAVKGSRVPIILITGFPDAPGRAAALNGGAIAYVSKVGAAEDLERAIALSLSTA